MPGSSRLQLDTWGCDASPEANNAPCRQQIYATNVGQKVFLVYTYCLCLCAYVVVIDTGGWWLPRQFGPNRSCRRVFKQILNDRPAPCPESTCRRAAAQVVPICCGYYFRATQIPRIKNQIWHRGRRQTCGDSWVQAALVCDRQRQLRRRGTICLFPPEATVDTGQHGQCSTFCM